MNWLVISISAAILVTLMITILLYFKGRRTPKLTKLRNSSRFQQPIISESYTKVTKLLPQVSSQQHLTLPRNVELTTTLRKLLASRQYKEADQETLKIMLQLTNREQEGWLDVASMENLKREDLQTLDRLWVESSNGRFGFSVQRHIWKNLGGDIGANDQIYQAFGDYVGWRVGQKWLQVNDLTCNLSSPIGHLPAVAVRLGGLSWGVEGFWWEKRDAYVFLLSRKQW